MERKPVLERKPILEDKALVNSYINKIHLGDCCDILRQMPEGVIDVVVTDPPYGLSTKEPDMKEVLSHWLSGEDYVHKSTGFMGKKWDSFVPSPKIWEQVFRVMKPGAHLLSFSGTRTYDLMTLAIRMAGMEVRDMINFHNSYDWTYGSGFPKSLSISKALDAKLLTGGSHSKNLKYVNENMRKRVGERTDPDRNNGFMKDSRGQKKVPITTGATDLAKKYADYGTSLKPAHEPIANFSKDGQPLEGDDFYYTAKASKFERNRGCEDLFWNEGESITKEKYDKYKEENKNGAKHGLQEQNNHPTVKPFKLAEYLIEMAMPPDGGVLLDPFCGSGTVCLAAMLLGYNYVGIDIEESSVIISNARLDFWANAGEKDLNKLRKIKN